MWSGGCAHHGTSRGWHDYCISRSDVSHCGGNCHANGGSHFYFRKAGFWSVRFYAIQHGALYHTRVRFQDNHCDILYIHMYKWTNTGWTQISGDLIWYFHANHHMRISILSDGTGYLLHAWGGAASWSRAQYTSSSACRLLAAASASATSQSHPRTAAAPALVSLIS
jgi:hypothetical protein